MNRWEERIEDIEEGRKEGLKEGRKEGRKEGIFEIATKMKDEGMKISEILKFTGLTEEEIQAL